MNIYRHKPHPPLGHHIEWLWYYVDLTPDHDREHVLPDGCFDLIINLENRPRKLFDRERAGRFNSFKRGWLSAAQEEFLIIDALPCSTMIGAHFKPGGAARFLGLPAGELGRQVVELDAIWGGGIWEAYSCGYFDQAHFANDFLAFAGVNPSAYLDRRLEEDPNFVRAAHR